MSPTIIEVAEQCGVSKSTVSLVLRGGSGIAPATRRAVMRAVKELNYRPNRAAQSLRTASTRVIGILVQDRLNPYYNAIVRAIEEVIQPEGYDLIVGETASDPAKEVHALDQMFARQVDGLIVNPIQYDQIEERLADYRAGGVNCLIFGPPSDRDVIYDSVTVNLREGTISAVEYLFEQGHRRIAFVAGAAVPKNITERIEAFRFVLSRHGLTMGDELVYGCGHTLRDGYEAGRHLLSMRRRPSAIFAINDLLAFGVMRAAHDMGLSVPGDVSVVGVDDIELSRYVTPSLTTVSQPIDRLAEAIASLMLRRLKGEQGEPEHVSLQAALLIRESTGAAPEPAGDAGQGG